MKNFPTRGTASCSITPPLSTGVEWQCALGQGNWRDNCTGLQPANARDIMQSQLRPKPGCRMLTASLMTFQVSGISWSYSSLNALLPGLGAPNVYTCTSLLVTNLINIHSYYPCKDVRCCSDMFGPDKLGNWIANHRLYTSKTSSFAFAGHQASDARASRRDVLPADTCTAEDAAA